MVCAAAYHCAALVLPTFAETAYSAGYPIWRHVLFVIIDVSFAGLLLWRPIWLIWPYTVLAVQQLKGHGGWTWTVWQQEGRIAWVDLTTVVGLCIGFWLLLVDWRERRARNT
jgi:hypothetical protein